MTEVQSSGLGGDYFYLTTTDNQKVYIRKESIAAIEHVPGTIRSEGHWRLYVSGYRFSVKEIPESWGLTAHSSPAAE